MILCRAALEASMVLPALRSCLFLLMNSRQPDAATDGARMAREEGHGEVERCWGFVTRCNLHASTGSPTPGSQIGWASV